MSTKFIFSQCWGTRIGHKKIAQPWEKSSSDNFLSTNDLFFFLPKINFKNVLKLFSRKIVSKKFKINDPQKTFFKKCSKFWQNFFWSGYKRKFPFSHQQLPFIVFDNERPAAGLGACPGRVGGGSLRGQVGQCSMCSRSYGRKQPRSLPSLRKL